MRQFIDIITEGMEPVVYHSTEWAPEIIADGIIKANSLVAISAISDTAIDYAPQTEDYVRGVCVTRSFYFARQFSNVIFALDLQKIKNNHRIIPRAERGAFDLANNHGDFRIEAEEFIICLGLSVDKYVTKIWISEEFKNEDGYLSIAHHPLFAGYFTQP